jgi:hypothetical protein
VGIVKTDKKNSEIVKRRRLSQTFWSTFRTHYKLEASHRERLFARPNMGILRRGTAVGSFTHYFLAVNRPA